MLNLHDSHSGYELALRLPPRCMALKPLRQGNNSLFAKEIFVPLDESAQGQEQFSCHFVGFLAQPVGKTPRPRSRNATNDQDVLAEAIKNAYTTEASWKLMFGNVAACICRYLGPRNFDRRLGLQRLTVPLQQFDFSLHGKIR
jgi:hypothetical protein